jgi:hypothetical protein
MTERTTKGWMGIVAFVLATVILGTAGAPAFAGEDGDAAGICWTAFENCLLWGIKSGLAFSGIGAGVFAAYCLTGYAFCERYVVPFLGEAVDR